jgi:hypothetical protein
LSFFLPVWASVSTNAAGALSMMVCNPIFLRGFSSITVWYLVVSLASVE